MSFDVQVRRAAELDVAEAQLWYEAQSSGLGAEFHSEVSQIIDRLAEAPLIYQIVHRDVRRAVVHRFPYLIWYRVLGEVVTVLACTHGRQDPSKAISRFKEKLSQ
ncbi:MAG TPA: recombinase [Blastocatellia bacterium]|nr:recombinase [Blastocatellia bacterium]